MENFLGRRWSKKAMSLPIPRLGGRKGWGQSETGGRQGGAARLLSVPSRHPKEVEGKALLLPLKPSESHSGHGLCPVDTWTLQARGWLLQQQVWRDACKGVRLPSRNCGTITGVLWPDPYQRGPASRMEGPQMRACVETSAGSQSRVEVRCCKGSM